MEVPDYNDEWKAELEYTKSGKLLCSIANILILENDPALAGRIVHDRFTGMDAAKTAAVEASAGPVDGQRR